MSISNRMTQRIEDDEGWGNFLGIMCLIALILLLLAALMSFAEKRDALAMQEEIIKEENLYISNFFEDEVVVDIVKSEIQGVNWNRKVDFIDGKSTYVQISCEISNQIEVNRSKDGVKREYECELTEIGNSERWKNN